MSSNHIFTFLFLAFSFFKLFSKLKSCFGFFVMLMKKLLNHEEPLQTSMSDTNFGKKYWACTN